MNAPAALEVDVVGLERVEGEIDRATVERLCAIAAASLGAGPMHLAVEFVDADRIRALNRDHRDRDRPTDVLSFPIDGDERLAAGAHAPRELGDVVICPAQTEDIAEAVVHGVLHLTGMDHEADAGEMLTLQRELLTWERRA